MKIELYSLKDEKLGKFAQPFCAPNKAIATRMLQSTINAGNSNIAEFPEDFQLYKLGSYDEDTGEFFNEKEFIINAIEFKTKKENEKE